jgi:capsular polysaccharide biosynthesis protein
MNPLSRLGDFYWKPQGCCPSLRTWHAGNARELRTNRVRRYVELGPGPDGDCYVAELTDAKVIGNAKLISTAANIVLGDVQFLYGAADAQNHWILAQRRLRAPRRLVGTAVVVAASNAENYYHWLFDSLPRLHLLRSAGHAFEEVDFFLLDDSARAFQIESLARIGIARERLWHCSKRRVTECSRLIVPSMPGPVGHPPRWVCDFLRRQFVRGQEEPPQRKVYISRQHARGRRILNESEMVPALGRHGYEIVHAERLTFAQQVELFASAGQVISMHGAGMSNIVFARPGARVLELGSRLHHNLLFRTLAANCDLRYEHLYLDAAPGAEKDDTRFANVVVDGAQFARKLEAFSA